MDKKKIAPIVLLVILAAAGGWIMFGGGADDDLEVRGAVTGFSKATAVGNKNSINGFIAQNFNDAGLIYADAIEEFGKKKPGYSVEMDAVNIRENKAEVSYTRKEIMDGKVVATAIVNEIWIKGNDGKWRLFKLSGKDRNRIIKARKEKKEKEAAMLLEQERAAGVEELDEKKKLVFYSPVGKRDPFESLIIEILPEGPAMLSASNKARRCDEKRPREYLESFDMFSIKLVGILKAREYLALVETQTGNGYTVKKGMFMGRNCGKIVKIKSNYIVVEEKYIRPRGDWRKKKTEISLRQEAGFIDG